MHNELRIAAPKLLHDIGLVFSSDRHTRELERPRADAIGPVWVPPQRQDTYSVGRADVASTPGTRSQSFPLILYDDECLVGHTQLLAASPQLLQ